MDIRQDNAEGAKQKSDAHTGCTTENDAYYHTTRKDGKRQIKDQNTDHNDNTEGNQRIQQ